MKRIEISSRTVNYVVNVQQSENNVTVLTFTNPLKAYAIYLQACEMYSLTPSNYVPGSSLTAGTPELPFVFMTHCEDLNKYFCGTYTDEVEDFVPMPMSPDKLDTEGHIYKEYQLGNVILN